MKTNRFKKNRIELFIDLIAASII